MPGLGHPSLETWIRLKKPNFIEKLADIVKDHIKIIQIKCMPFDWILV